MVKAQMNWTGQVLGEGRYRVESEVGFGGMAHVYMAHDCNLQTKVVVKIPHPSLLLQEGFAQRFEREIKALVHLAHPHVVKVMDVGTQGRMPFAVMQYLSGGNLNSRRSHKKNGGWLPVEPRSLVTWLPQVAAALDFLHQQNFVHRDVKPDNILFDQSSNVYLADFGIVKAIGETAGGKAKTLTKTGMTLGTPEYMAPEVCLGKQVDGRADQYSLASMVYELLAGRCPILGPNPLAILVAQSNKVPAPLCQLAPHISQTLSDVVARGLEKDPAKRFANCGAFASAVTLGISQEQAPPDALKQRCPHCKTKVKIPPNLAGKQLRCPNCHTPFQSVTPNRIPEVRPTVGTAMPIRPTLSTENPRAANPLPPAVVVNPATVSSGYPANPGYTANPALPAANTVSANPIPATPYVAPGKMAPTPTAPRRKGPWHTILIGTGIVAIVSLVIVLTVIFVGKSNSTKSSTGGSTPTPGQMVLRWDFKAGKPFYYEYDEKLEEVMENQKIGKKTKNQRTTLLYRVVPRRKDNNRDWILDASVVGAKNLDRQDGKVRFEYDSTKNGDPTGLPNIFDVVMNSRFTFTLTPDMKVKNMAGLDALFNRFEKKFGPAMADKMRNGKWRTILQMPFDTMFILVPNKKVKIGTSWSRTKSEENGKVFKMTRHFSYVYAGRKNNIDVISIRVRGDAAMPNMANNTLNVTNVDMKETGKGEATFDPKAKRLSTSRVAARLKGTVTFEIMGVLEVFSMDSTVTTGMVITDRLPQAWQKQ